MWPVCSASVDMAWVCASAPARAAARDLRTTSITRTPWTRPIDLRKPRRQGRRRRRQSRPHRRHGDRFRALQPSQPRLRVPQPQGQGYLRLRGVLQRLNRVRDDTGYLGVVLDRRSSHCRGVDAIQGFRRSRGQGTVAARGRGDTDARHRAACLDRSPVMNPSVSTWNDPHPCSTTK